MPALQTLPEHLAVAAARRCHVCGAPFPAFGFGPPLTREGEYFWACGEHRATVERMLAPPEPPGESDPSQGSLF
jgi:hypothetical protein